MNLLTDPIPRVVRGIAVPAGTGMMFTTFFNITDTWFAGLWSTHALAALGLSFPVFFIVISAGVGLGQGTTALIANALGREDPTGAVCLWIQSTYIAAALSLLVAVAGFTVLDPVLSILTQHDDLAGLTKAYLLPLLAGGIFFMAGQAANALLVAQGDTKSYRNSLIAGFAANIALNPLLMFGVGPVPGMGVVGIAAATVAVQAGQLLYLLDKIRTCGLVSQPDQLLKFRPALIVVLAKQVVPASFSMLAIGVGLFVITHFIGRFGPEAVAAYGIGLRIEQLAMLPMIGLGAAAISMVGQNFGAGQWPRVQETTRYVIIAASLMMAVGALAVAAFNLPILKFFSDDPKVIEIGQDYLFVAVLIFNAYAILHVCTAVMQGLKYPMAGLIVGLTRHVIAPPIVLTLIAPIFGLHGIFWSIFAMSWMGAGLISLLLWRTKIRLSRTQTMAG